MVCPIVWLVVRKVAVCLRLANLLAMRFIGTLIEKLQRHPKRIVFPEGAEPRVLHAARQFHLLRLGAPILLGNQREIRETAAHLKISLDGIRIIAPEQSPELEDFARRFRALRRSKGMHLADARDAMLNPNYFGAMLVALRRADGLVTGSTQVSSAVLRPLSQIFKPSGQNATVAGCMIVEFENTRFGENGVLFLADCDVNPDPKVEQLADIAVSTAHLARHLLGVRPRVALLSFSTKDPNPHRAAGKVQAATALAAQKARQQGLSADFDGELQADAAIVPEIASVKAPSSKVAGRANVLIFPDLASGSIASKLIRQVAHANAYGHILLGFDRPAADVSRGSSAHDILGVAIIVGIQAITYNELYLREDHQFPAVK